MSGIGDSLLRRIGEALKLAAVAEWRGDPATGRPDATPTPASSRFGAVLAPDGGTWRAHAEIAHRRLATIESTDAVIVNALRRVHARQVATLAVDAADLVAISDVITALTSRFPSKGTIDEGSPG